VRELAERLIEIPGVVAVTLGGSRAGGVIHPDSDWDFGLYYRDAIRADDVRALGFEGTVVEPGAWGRLVNGGAWLTVEDQRVDLLYRDLDVVQHWLEEARPADTRSAPAAPGRAELDQVSLLPSLPVARPGPISRWSRRRPWPGRPGARPAVHGTARFAGEGLRVRCDGAVPT
jgi:Nucleotidyltransferase domain